jgi:enoyl-CoA hydratase/carnithine racemase
MFSTALFLLGFLCTHTVLTSPLLSEEIVPIDYKTLSFRASNNVTRVSINNPPINLCDYKLINDLHNFLVSLDDAGANPEVNASAAKIVVFTSANRDFFIGHADIHQFSLKNPLPPTLHLNSTLINLKYFAITRLLASLPQIFIAEISGRAIGTGQELAVQMDMRFASPGAKFGGLEVALGDFPGVGGLQYMSRLIGLGRTAELVLGQGNVDAVEAETIGLVNKAFKTANAMNMHVNTLVERIALWPSSGIIATKRGLRDGSGPSEKALETDGDKFTSLSQLPALQAGANRFLQLSGQVMGSYEMNIPEDLAELYR